MATYRYFGQYSDSSYSSYDRQYMNGFKSITDAHWFFQSVQSGQATGVEFQQNANGAYVLWENTYSQFPATTSAGELLLYRGERNSDGEYYVSDAPFYRISVGERGGVKGERC